MREVEEERAPAAHHHVGMLADHAVVLAAARLREQVGALLARPPERVGGAIDGEPLPGVGDRPVRTPEPEDLRPLAGLVADHPAPVAPRGEVRAVGVTTTGSAAPS
jgi:hypothetical protein